MRWKNTIAVACLGFAALPAAAQVHRCKHPTGKVVYTDQPCAQGQAGGVIEPTPSVREIAWEQARAAAMPPGLQTKAQGADAAANPPLCRKAREELNTITALRTMPPEERRIRLNGAQTRMAAACGTAPATALPPPASGKALAAERPQFVYCDTSFCHDNKGGIHMKSGPDLVDSATGKRCARVGAQMHCV